MVKEIKSAARRVRDFQDRRKKPTPKWAKWSEKIAWVLTGVNAILGFFVGADLPVNDTWQRAIQWSVPATAAAAYAMKYFIPNEKNKGVVQEPKEIKVEIDGT